MLILNNGKDVMVEFLKSIDFADLKARVLTSLVLIPLVLAVFYIGSPLIELFITIVCGLMAYEWAKLVSNGKLAGSSVLMTVSCVSALILITLSRPTYAWTILLLGAALTYISARLDRHQHPLWMSLGAVYATVPCMAMIWLMGENIGPQIVIWLIGLVWVTDIFAYFGGKLVGGKKLAPLISPKKTWAGLIIGVMSAGIWGVVFSSWQGLDAPGWLFILSVFTSCVAQVSDLFESLVKRRFNVKNSSEILPGHGGVLDRLDGFIFSLPLCAWLLLKWSDQFFVGPF